MDRIASINIKGVEEATGLPEPFNAWIVLFANLQQLQEVMNGSKFQAVGNYKGFKLLFRCLLEMKAYLRKVICALNARAGKAVIFFCLVYPFFGNFRQHRKALYLP